MNYLLGNSNPLLALIPPKIREIDFCDCLASDLGWAAVRAAAVGTSLTLTLTPEPQTLNPIPETLNPEP